MLGVLDVPYRDTGADALAFALDEPPHPALAVATVHTAAIPVELRLLGASHQVVAGPVTETVACLPGRAGGLPGAFARPVGGWEYTFTARTLVLADDAAFAAAVARIAALLDRPDALSGAFPGVPGALTGIVVDPAGTALSWRTWHTYPQTRELVETRTGLTPVNASHPHTRTVTA